MRAELVLAVKPNSTACRAAGVFGKMHRDLWPSACSLPPAAAQRLLFTWQGEGEQEEKRDLSLWCILTYPVRREESGSVWWQGGQSQPGGHALLLQMFPSW